MYLNRKQTLSLMDFERCLKELFVADIKITNCSKGNDALILIIELYSKSGFLKGLSNIRMSIFDKDDLNFDEKLVSYFKYCFLKLKHSFSFSVDIAEVSLNFQDTAVVIQRVSKNSILNELKDIIKDLMDYAEFCTNIFKDVPNEIHVPVFEELTNGPIDMAPDIITFDKYISPYRKFWGLYYPSFDHAIIYDLNTMTAVPGKLYLNLDGYSYK